MSSATATTPRYYTPINKIEEMPRSDKALKSTITRLVDAFAAQA